MLFRSSLFFNADGSLAHHRIFSVPHFGNTFPDANDVQLTSAKKRGVKPVADRHAAENMKKELVYIGSNPYFHVDRLKSSIPYLVPEASVLLQDIGRNFFDSLQVKGIPLHKIIVTSVLRSKADIEKLRGIMLMLLKTVVIYMAPHSMCAITGIKLCKTLMALHADKCATTR